MRTKAFALSLVVALTSAFPSHMSAQGLEFASSAAVKVVMDQLLGGLNGIIEKARAAGDYLLVRAGVEAKDAIENWKLANTSLLDNAFSSIDQASRDNFIRAHQLLESANRGVQNGLETARQITENANQILESIPASVQDAYVLRYSPHVMPPQAKDAFLLRVRGVNLDKSDPRLLFNGAEFKRDLTGPLEVLYTIPVNEMKHDQSVIGVRSLMLNYSVPSDAWYNRLFGKRELVKREIPVMVMPVVMGRYVVTGTRTYNNRITKEYDNDLGKFEGRHTTQEKVGKPEVGWKWDLTKPFVVIPVYQEGGTCGRVEINKSNDQGIVVNAQLDEIRKWDTPGGTDGKAFCKVKGTIYRDELITESIPQKDGALSWTEDRLVDIPKDTTDVAVAVELFDGRKRMFPNGTGTDKFFTVRKEPKAIIITPIVPGDLL